MNKDHDEDEKESFKPPPKVTELSAMAHIPNDSSKISNIPAAELMNPMQSFGNQPVLSSDTQDSYTNSNSSNDPTAATRQPSLQSNMFKMQRNKSESNIYYVYLPLLIRNTIHISLAFTALKKSYVDVFNPSGTTPKNDIPILAPMMPTLQTQPNVFVPAAVLCSNQQNVSYLEFYNLIYFIQCSLQRNNMNSIQLET